MLCAQCFTNNQLFNALLLRNIFTDKALEQWLLFGSWGAVSATIFLFVFGELPVQLVYFLKKVGGSAYVLPRRTYATNY